MDVALVVGEALVDVVRRDAAPEVVHPGGSAANVAIALARLGLPTWFATGFAADAHGALISDWLRRDGVRLATDPQVVAATSAAVATIDAQGSATYDFAVDSARSRCRPRPCRAWCTCVPTARCWRRGRTRSRRSSPGCARARRSATTSTCGRR